MQKNSLYYTLTIPCFYAKNWFLALKTVITLQKKCVLGKKCLKCLFFTRIKTKQVLRQHEANGSSGRNNCLIRTKWTIRKDEITVKTRKKKYLKHGTTWGFTLKISSKKRNFSLNLQHLNQVIKPVFFCVGKIKIRFLVMAVVWCCLWNSVALQTYTCIKIAEEKMIYHVVLLWLIATHKIE